MKTKLIGLLLFVLILASCKTKQHTSQATSTEDITVIHDKLTPVALPRDSAMIRAYFECDSSFNVVLKELKEIKSRNIQASFDYGNGVFEYDLRTGGDTVYIPGKDYYKRINTRTYTTKTITKTKTVKVEKELSGWERWQMKAGKIFMFLCCIAVLYAIFRYRQIILKILIKIFSLFKI